MAAERFGLLHSLALIAISASLAPLTGYILLCSYALQALLPRLFDHHAAPRNVRHPSLKILISGINTSAGLSLARSLHQAGHYIVGTDCQLNHVPGIGRVSRAVKRFHTLPVPEDELGTTEYVHALLRVVEKEKVAIWISCSAFTSPMEDSLAKEIIERKTECRCLAFNMHTTSSLMDIQEFLGQIKDMGLPAPESHEVTSRDELHKVLRIAAEPSRSFTIAKTRSKHAASDASNAVKRASRSLPGRSISETYQLVSEIPISPQEPHVIEEDVQGKEYIAHSIIIRASVEAFAVAESPGPRLEIRGLSARSGIHQAMLKFTQRFASKFGHELTGHLSTAFKVQETATERGSANIIIPVACKPSIETPSLLLQLSNKELAFAITSIVQDPVQNGVAETFKEPVAPDQSLDIHWVGWDLIHMVFLPAVGFLNGKTGLKDVSRTWFLFGYNLTFWKDATFEVWDPLPWWWQYHIYWPMQLLYHILRRRTWSYIDLTTGRIHE